MKPAIIYTIDGQKYIVHKRKPLLCHHRGIAYYKGQLVHRLDGPAFIDFDGVVQWYRRGKHHRIGGPALIKPKYKRWYKNGQIHRENGPAIIDSAKGIKHWFQHGKSHRVDGPAYEHINGTRMWYYQGEYHRTDGPAVFYDSENYNYWIYGKRLTEEEFNNYRFTRWIKNES